MNRLDYLQRWRDDAYWRDRNKAWLVARGSRRFGEEEQTAYIAWRAD